MYHLMMGLTRCYKTAVFTYIYLLFLISIYSWGDTTFAFRKQTDAIWKFYFRFRFWTFYHHRHVILRQRDKFYPNWTITKRVMTICRFFKMRPYGGYSVANLLGLLLSGFMTSRL